MIKHIWGINEFVVSGAEGRQAGKSGDTHLCLGLPWALRFIPPNVELPWSSLTPDNGMGGSMLPGNSPWREGWISSNLLLSPPALNSQEPQETARNLRWWIELHEKPSKSLWACDNCLVRRATQPATEGVLVNQPFSNRKCKSFD